MIGSHGYTAPGRFFLDSVSQKVVTKARCSVRIARERPGGHIAARENPIRLLLGVDGSPDAEAAVQVALQRQWSKGSQARVVNASLKLPLTASDRDLERVAEWIPVENARVEQVVESAVNRLRAIGLETTSLRREEDPRKLLISEAENWRADSIFVGAKGLGMFER